MAKEISSRMPQAIEGLRTLQESYDALATRNVEQEEGRKAIAHAITEKGVPTPEDSSMQQMAENVGLIQQETYELEGAPIYEKQMFGAETISPIPYKQNGPLWNLYKVMTDLLSDARFINYGGILLAEYYKGFDTIELMNVGAGGCYLTSDGDLYFTDKTGENAHVWHDAEDGKMNRWVAYIFAAPSTNYTIPSTELCPRSIHIGREVGTIICPNAGRISQIVVTDGNHLLGTNFGTSQVWGNHVVIHNMKEHTAGTLLFSADVVESAYIDVEEINSHVGTDKTTGSLIGLCVNLSNVFCLAKTMTDGYVVGRYGAIRLEEINMPLLEYMSDTARLFFMYSPEPVSGWQNFKRIRCASLKRCNYLFESAANNAETCPSIEHIYLPSIEELVGGVVVETAIYGMPKLIDFEVGALRTKLYFRFWNPTTVLSTPEGIATINANIRDHIAAKVSDRTGQTALIFTISTNLYNNLEQATKDAFTAKNWEVRGA